MNIVVTGGAGFIGANLCRALLVQPQIERVTVVDDFSTGIQSNLDGLQAEVLTGSILDKQLLAEAIRNAEAIVHLAARPSVPRSLRDPVASHEANVTGTLNVLEVARELGAPHVIVASSSSVYGDSRSLPKHEELPVAPLSPYAATKLAAESYALAWAHSFDLPVLALRFFNVYGPLQRADHAYAAVIPRFISAAIEKRPLEIHGDGTQTRDFTFVDSVTEVITQAVLRRVTYPGPVNLAFGGRITINSLVEILQDVMATKLDIHHVPRRDGDVRDSQAGTVRLGTLFPSVGPVSLRDGIDQTYRWFLETTLRSRTR